jgi:TetR/AcrR family fatty acid metabolism transcriptional regulator
MATRGDKREGILDAAVRVFARNGFHQSRVSEIAREAGVADGTIYLYFRHKEDILIAIFEEKMAVVIALLLEELEGVTDPAERLRRFIEFHLTQMARNRPLAEILQVELRLSNKFMKEYVPVKLTEYLEIIAEIVAEGQRLGQFRPELNPAMLKRAIFGALDELAMHWVLTRGRRPDLKDSAAQLAEVFLRGVCVPAAPRPVFPDEASTSASVSTLTGGQT